MDSLNVWRNITRKDNSSHASRHWITLRTTPPKWSWGISFCQGFETETGVHCLAGHWPSARCRCHTQGWSRNVLEWLWQSPDLSHAKNLLTTAPAEPIPPGGYGNSFVLRNGKVFQCWWAGPKQLSLSQKGFLLFWNNKKKNPHLRSWRWVRQQNCTHVDLDTVIFLMFNTANITTDTKQGFQ